MRQPIQVLIYPVRQARNDREYLLLRRVASRGGFWQGVTGGVEEGEELFEAARRELTEETGLVPSELEKIDYSYTFPVEDRWRHLYAPDVETIIEYVFVAYVDGQQEPKIDPGEHAEWKWCPFHEALELLTWPENIEALKQCDSLMRARVKHRAR